MSASSIALGLLTTLVQLTSDVEPVNAEQYVTHDYFQEVYWLATAAYFETGGESFQDKIDVAHSIMNRVYDTREFRRYNSVRRVVQKSNGTVCWYSWYCNGKSNTPYLLHPDNTYNDSEVRAWKDSVVAAFYAYEDMYHDRTHGATHFYNDEMVNPSWASHYQVTMTYGAHVFLK